MVKTEHAGAERRFRGVRRRKWGRWVSEIRLPNSRERIWLGSYDSPEKAARAFDAAVVCLRGLRGRLNFPDAPPRISGGRSLNARQIQAAAAHHAHSDDFAGAVAAPEMSQSEIVTAEGGDALDWSFMDLPTAPDGVGMDFLATTMDDFAYDFFPPAPASVPPDAAEENGVGFEANSVLWSF